jgi:hypothetical protein
MRRRISERNQFPDFDVKHECKKIYNMFSQTNCVNYDGEICSCEYMIGKFLFCRWKLRGTFTSLLEMQQALGVTIDDVNSDDFDNDKALDFLQYILNCVFYIGNEIQGNYKAEYFNRDLAMMIIDNTSSIIKELGCFFTIDKETDEILIQYKSDTVDAVAENHPEVKRSLTEYRYHDCKGDLQRKGEILCTLYKDLESFSKNVTEKPESTIFSETSYLFNATGARHWKEGDIKRSKPFLDMKEPELEQWYDKTFEMYVACKAIADSLEVVRILKGLRKDTKM